jgi:DNA repair protein RecN (Recombination protein N)
MLFPFSGESCYFWDMLQRLLIHNYAIIAALEIDFRQGLTIITGETGAGKSILMGALGLALGDRADLSQMKDRTKKTFVEATFLVEPSAALKQFFEAAELEEETEILIRREIHASGKSRAFINDSPVGLSQLQTLAALLVDLHQQFDTLELSRRHFQGLLLDASAAALGLMADYTMVYNRFVQVQKSISELREQLQKAEQEKAYNEFLLGELEELNWGEGEEKSLEEELSLLSHAEQIRMGIGRVVFGLGEGEQPLVPQLKSMLTQLQALAAYHTTLAEHTTRLESAYLEVKDLQGALELLLNEVSVDDKRLEEVNKRLAQAQHLARKHGLVSPDELVSKRESLSNTLQQLVGRSDELAHLEKEQEKLTAQATDLAAQLRVLRKKESPRLENATREMLSRVGMPNAVLKINLREISLSPSGMDEVSFLFDANKSGSFEPLHKVASGGELSRLMLVLKSLVAGSLDMPTLIFDEIDSGISGEAAKQVGVLMQELSANHQLIAITHQPQIAARASQHLYVFKQEEEGVIQTNIKELSADERVQAIARMLAGEKPGEAAMATARDMMKN